MGGGPPGRGGAELDPLVAANNAARPLISKLLVVPALRSRYLQYVHQMADYWLDSDRGVGPLIAAYSDLIDADMKSDSRMIYTYENFVDDTASDSENSLQGFARQRRRYLLNHTEVQSASKEEPLIEPIESIRNEHSR